MHVANLPYWAGDHILLLAQKIKTFNPNGYYDPNHINRDIQIVHVSLQHINRNSVNLTQRFSLKLFYFTFMSQQDPLISTNRHLFHKKKSVKIPNIIPLCKFYFSLFCRCFYEIILRLMSTSIVPMFCAQNGQLIIKCLKIGAPSHIFPSSVPFLYPKHPDSHRLICIPGGMMGEERESNKSLTPQ